ncbi:MAG: ATP-binding protein [Campylobacterota bacterium]|nr:ATP-binding protein [Campylobacterota bacterium]
MTILDHIYETNIPKHNFHERKKSISSNNTILYGPPKSGKTYLIYDYLSSFKSKEFLYIDLNDYKNDKEDIKSYLNYFTERNKIKVVVLENFDFDFDLPKVTNIIITSKQHQNIKGFETILLEPLDFEEYLLFDTKHQNISYSFNSFLKYGNFPEIIEYSEQKKHKRNYEICQLYCEDKTDLEILFLLIKSASEIKSVYQLFNQLKNKIKISKDRFYKSFDQLEQSKVIHSIQKYNQPKAAKKLFIFNHALLDIVSYKKNFNNLFKNMVFLELNALYSDIYYLDNMDFYIPSEDMIVLSIPFFNELVSSTVIAKIIPLIDKYNIKDIMIITVSGEKNIYIDNIEAQVITYYDWVLAQ